MDESERPKTILLADDDPMIIGLFRTKLEKEGYHLLIARDGEEALRLAKTGKPQLILLDVLMPKMTGVGVLRSLKADLDTQSIPVLVMTNLEKEGNPETAKQLGALDYVIKGEIDPATLAAKIKAILSA